MTELGTILLIILLIGAVLYWRKRKTCSSCCSSTKTAQAGTKTPEPVKPQQETKLDEKAVATAAAPKASVGKSPESKSSATDSSAKTQTKETKVSVSECACLMPEDSILKRHYISQVCSMIELVNSARPTDSVLSRHYDAMIFNQVVRCLNDKKAMEQLVDDYEKGKK